MNTRSRCLTSAVYPTTDDRLEDFNLSVEEVPGDLGRQELAMVEIGLSGTQLRRADGGAPVTDAAPLRLLMPPEALPAFARALEHACLSAVRSRLIVGLRPTTALHALLPLLTLDTVCSIAHELGTARAREAGDGAAYVLNAMLVAEVGARSPRDAVLEAVLRALRSWPGTEAAS
ncbi:MAG: hypothetical protein ACYC3F_05265 [Gemmatimonadaceae bacterium]